MPKVDSRVNLKRGVGKTALAVALADYLIRRNNRTLLIDLR